MFSLKTLVFKFISFARNHENRIWWVFNGELFHHLKDSVEAVCSRVNINCQTISKYIISSSLFLAFSFKKVYILNHFEKSCNYLMSGKAKEDDSATKRIIKPYKGEQEIDLSISIHPSIHPSYFTSQLCFSKYQRELIGNCTWHMQMV